MHLDAELIRLTAGAKYAELFELQASTHRSIKMISDVIT